MNKLDNNINSSFEIYPKGSGPTTELQAERYQKLLDQKILFGMTFENFIKEISNSVKPINSLIIGEAAEWIAAGYIEFEDLNDYDALFVMKDAEALHKAYNDLSSWLKDYLIPSFLSKNATHFKLKIAKFEITFSIHNDYFGRHVVYADNYEYDIQNKLVKYHPKFNSQEEFEKVKNSTQLRDFEDPLNESNFPIYRIIKSVLQGYELPYEYLMKYLQKFYNNSQKHEHDLDDYLSERINKTISANNPSAKLISNLTYVFNAYVLSENDKEFHATIQKNAQAEIKRILKQSEKCYSTLLYDLSSAISDSLDNLEKWYGNQALLQLLGGIDIFSPNVKWMRFAEDGTITVYTSKGEETILKGKKKWQYIHLPFYSTHKIAQTILKASWLADIDIFNNKQIKILSENSEALTLQTFFKKIPKIISEKLGKFENIVPKNMTVELLLEQWDTVVRQWVCGENSNFYLSNLATMITLGSLLDPENDYVKKWFNSYCKVWLTAISKDGAALQKYLIPIYPIEYQFQGLIDLMKESKKIEFATLHEIVKVMIEKMDEKKAFELISELISSCGSSTDVELYKEMNAVINELIKGYHDEPNEENEWLISWIIKPSFIYTPLEMKNIQKGWDEDKIALQCSSVFDKIISTEAIEKTEVVHKLIKASSSFNSKSLEVQRSIIKTNASLLENWLSKKNRSFKQVTEMWKAASKGCLSSDNDLETIERQKKLLDKMATEFIKAGVQGIDLAFPLLERLIELKEIDSVQDLIGKGLRIAVKGQNWKAVSRYFELTKKITLKDMSKWLNCLLDDLMQSETTPKTIKDKNDFIAKILAHSDFKISSEMAEKYIEVLSKLAPQMAAEWMIDFKLFSSQAIQNVWSILDIKEIQGVVLIMNSYLKDRSIEERKKFAYTIDKAVQLSDDEVLGVYLEIMLSTYAYLNVDDTLSLLRKAENQPKVYQNLYSQDLLLPISRKCYSNDKNCINKIFQPEVFNDEAIYKYLQMLLSNNYYKFGDVEITPNIFKLLAAEELRKIVQQVVRQEKFEEAYTLMKSAIINEKEQGNSQFTLQDDHQSLYFSICIHLAQNKAGEPKERALYLNGAYSALDSIKDKSKVLKKDFEVINNILQNISKNKEFDFSCKENAIFIINLFVVIDKICSNLDVSPKIFNKSVSNLLESIIDRRSSVLSKITSYIGSEKISELYLKIISNATLENDYLSLVGPLITDSEQVDIIYALAAKERELNQIVYSSKLIDRASVRTKSILEKTLFIDILLGNYDKEIESGTEIVYDFLLELFLLNPSDYISERNFVQFQCVSALIDNFDLGTLINYMKLINVYEIKEKKYEKIYVDIAKKLFDHFSLLSQIEDRSVRKNYFKLIVFFMTHKSFATYCSQLEESIIEFSLACMQARIDFFALEENEKIFSYISLRHAVFETCFLLYKSNTEKEIHFCNKLIEKMREKKSVKKENLNNWNISEGVELILGNLKNKKNMFNYVDILFESMQFCEECIKIKYESNQLLNWLDALEFLFSSEAYLKDEKVFDKFIKSAMNFTIYLDHCNRDTIPLRYKKLITEILECKILSANQKKKKETKNSCFENFDKKYPNFFIEAYTPLCRILLNCNDLNFFDQNLKEAKEIAGKVEKEYLKNDRHEEYYKFLSDYLCYVANRFMQVKSQLTIDIKNNEIIYDKKKIPEFFGKTGKLQFFLNEINESMHLSKKHAKNKHEKESAILKLYRAYYLNEEHSNCKNLAENIEEFAPFAKNFAYCALIKYLSETGEIKEAEKKIDGINFELLNTKTEKQLLLKQLQILGEFWIYSSNPNRESLLSYLFDKLKNESNLEKKEKIEIIARIVSAYINNQLLYNENNVNDYLNSIGNYMVDFIEEKEDYIHLLTVLLKACQEVNTDTKTIKKSLRWNGYFTSLVEVLSTCLEVLSPIESSIQVELNGLKMGLLEYHKNFEMSKEVQGNCEAMIASLLKCYVKVDKENNDVNNQVKRALIILEWNKNIVHRDFMYLDVVNEKKE